ncbi:MAG TPA: 2-C-methyl-D-erythritol 4-phosphate cytidylyltransferase [Candidatus Eisenbacteria bacterium]|nr:2-C-methyl-D-erythritol 4-phosphate cytidylyltransferase [Candidatus Eisenbacteria bacterium]
MSVAAILLCGGSGARLGLEVAKPLVPLAGRPLFAWSLEALERCSAIDHIVVVGPVKPLRDAAAACGLAAAKVMAWGAGGRERQQSVARGLAALPADAEIVAVHDCARALIEPALIARVVLEARTHGAAIAAIALDDTLKRGTLARIEATVPRAHLWRAQTPQVFRRDWFEAAHAQAVGHATDDAALVEALGHPVALVDGDPVNFKITAARDLALAEAWLEAREARATTGGGAR